MKFWIYTAIIFELVIGLLNIYFNIKLETASEIIFFFIGMFLCYMAGKHLAQMHELR